MINKNRVHPSLEQLFYSAKSCSYLVSVIRAHRNPTLVHIHSMGVCIYSECSTKKAYQNPLGFFFQKTKIYGFSMKGSCFVLQNPMSTLNTIKLHSADS